MIDELAYRHALGEGRQAADMIAMEMGRDEEVEAVDTGVPQRGLDPFGVACVLAVPAGIHQDGLVRRGDDERRGAPFDVDPIDVEGGPGWLLRDIGEQWDDKQDACREAAREPADARCPRQGPHAPRL